LGKPPHTTSLRGKGKAVGPEGLEREGQEVKKKEPGVLGGEVTEKLKILKPILQH